jgi:hypothetical protein
VKLVGANHCDPEKDNDVFGCGLTCGFWSSTRHQRYLRYVTGWFEYYLRCDGSYKEWVFGERVASDLTGALITYDANGSPLAPVGLVAAWNGEVEVVRDPPIRCQGVDFWRLYRSETPGSGFVLVADGLPVSTTSWLDPTAQPGRTYYYRARDVLEDFRAEYESADSNEAVVATSSPGEASPEGSPMLASRGTGSSVDVSFAVAACAGDHAAFVGQSAGPITGGLVWSSVACGLGMSGNASVDTGTPPAGSLQYFVVIGNADGIEGSYGRNSQGAERPESSGLPACDWPQRLGGC